MDIDRRIRQIGAFTEGRRNGATDRLLGIANEYALQGLVDARDSYAYHYALGYRVGQQEDN